MSTTDDLDARIRLVVLELLDASPPAPVLLQLEDLPPRRWWRHPSVGWRFVRGSRRRPLVGIGLALSAIGVLVGARLATGSGSSTQITEAALGMRVVGYSSMASTPAPPPGYVVVATGTAFGRPWVVAGLPPSTGRIGEWLEYAGRSLISGSAPLGSPTFDTTRFGGPRAALHLGVGLASDNQRFLVGSSNGPVATVTVRAKDGTAVTGSVLPHRLGTTRFFVLSLGRQSDCHQLCQGAVTVSVADSGGRVLATRTISDFGGLSTYLDAPPATTHRGR